MSASSSAYRAATSERAGQDPVELLELAEPDRGPDVVDPVVEPEPGVVEPAAAVGATLVAQALEQLPRLLRRTS